METVKILIVVLSMFMVSGGITHAVFSAMKEENRRLEIFVGLAVTSMGIRLGYKVFG